MRQPSPRCSMKNFQAQAEVHHLFAQFLNPVLPHLPYVQVFFSEFYTEL
jgi:hypothetical protein